MSSAGRPLRVFLCHAHADRDRVHALYTRLTKDAVDAWLDKEKLLPGQDWELEIRKAVREADVVVVCLSKQFNQAGFRQKEVRLALDTAMEKPEGEIFIIPARLEECDNLESLRKWHWVDLFEDNGYEMLMRAFRARADKIGATLQIKKDISSSQIVQNNQSVAPQIYQQKETSKTRVEVNKPKRKINFRRLIASIALMILSMTGILAFVIPLLNLPTKSIEPTPTSNSTFTPTSIPTEITDTKGVQMVLVPAGKFTMGVEAEKALSECFKYRPDCDRSWFIYQEPPHDVYLDTFYIDKYEVTNLSYKTCVNAGVCLPPKRNDSSTRPSYYDNSEFDHYPVINVDWNMARTFCEWRGGRLPTEAEWEKAARGMDGRTYPWGEGFFSFYSNAGNFGAEADTTLVGSYKMDKSPFGVYDMAGNVREWVFDWVSFDYYMNSPSSNPLGPDTGQYRIQRGNSWGENLNNLFSAKRKWGDPVEVSRALGFRCAFPAQ